MISRLVIKKNWNNTYKFVNLPLRFKSKISRSLWKDNDIKLANSISRARTKCFDYAINNDFYYFVTLTTNCNYNGYDIDKLRRDISDIVRSMRKRFNGNFKYLLIPELHKSGKYHLHGFFTRDFGLDFYINDKNYLSWFSYDKIGFSSIELIRDNLRSSKYITKYITKELVLFGKGKHVYFCSQHLNSSYKVFDGVVKPLSFDFDYENDFCKIKEVSSELFNDCLSDISNKLLDYYN